MRRERVRRSARPSATSADHAEPRGSERADHGGVDLSPGTYDAALSCNAPDPANAIIDISASRADITAIAAAR